VRREIERECRAVLAPQRSPSLSLSLSLSLSRSLVRLVRRCSCDATALYSEAYGFGSREGPCAMRRSHSKLYASSISISIRRCGEGFR